MGRLVFPKGSRIYLDAAPIIYSVEKHLRYWPILESLWISAKNGDIILVTSELTLLEVLVKPVSVNNQPLIEAYESLLIGSDIDLFPISTSILREAENIRAAHNLKTPDAIHAATAINSECDHLVANDTGLRRLTRTDVVILDDLI